MLQKQDPFNLYCLVHIVCSGFQNLDVTAACDLGIILPVEFSLELDYL